MRSPATFLIQRAFAFSELKLILDSKLGIGYWFFGEGVRECTDYAAPGIWEGGWIVYSSGKYWPALLPADFLVLYALL